MKRVFRLFSCFGLVLALTGCVGISIGNKQSKPAHSPPPAAPVMVVASDPSDPATLAEIEAAAGLSMDEARSAALNAIAQRPSLSPAAQVHLANTAYKRLDFDNHKVTVLLSLIQNPAFCAPTKQAIMAQLNKLSFDHDRQAILNAVNELEKASGTGPGT